MQWHLRCLIFKHLVQGHPIWSQTSVNCCTCSGQQKLQALPAAWTSSSYNICWSIQPQLCGLQVCAELMINWLS